MIKYVLYRNEPQANEMEYITSSYVQALMKANVNYKLNDARLRNANIPAHDIVAIGKKYVVVKVETRNKR
jgi:hypothetical protein